MVSGEQPYRDGRTKAKRTLSPATWVPSSYLAEGIPFAMVIWVSGTMFKDLGHTDTEITLATGSIGIAWSLKPFWSPFLDMFRTKKFWVLSMEFLMAGLLGAVALSLTLPSYFTVILGLLWVLAFASATQDICVDGVYISALSREQQAGWIGFQGTFWNGGRIFGQAAVVGIAGWLKTGGGMDAKTAWMYALGASAATMGLLGVYHSFFLPTGSISVRPKGAKEIVTTFGDTLGAFFKKKAIWGMLAFVFLFRTGEGLLLVEAPLFMQASVHSGGLGLTLSQKALVDGTISTVVSLIAGILGGKFIERYGLRRSLFFLALCLNVPHLCYIFLSYAVSPDAPLSMTTISILVTIEKFGYSFGFVANMLYMMQQIAPGKYKMVHYSFCTALMNLVLQPTQMASGRLADWLGYRHFFILVLVASIPSLIAAWLAPFPNPPDVDSDETGGPTGIPPEPEPRAEAAA
jgi:MFS transporter, PAT family, beta-lactamase induction signal transducer AmpG